MISKRVLLEKSAKYPEARTGLQVWLETAQGSDWRSLEDMRRVFPATDMIGSVAIFNIKGNSFRLIARIVFPARKIYIKEFLTHAEYDRERWKKWL